MKSLEQFILEKEEEKADVPALNRGDIKFTIWQKPDKKVHWIDNNNDYQKIEYKLNDKEAGIKMQFLLGFKDGSWKLWVGKIGAVSYDDDPYCSFDTDTFRDAIIACLDKCEEIVKDVKENPDNWVQYYINL